MKQKIIFAVLILLFPLIVYADEIKLDCPESITPKSEFTCKITGNSSMKITGISAKVSINDSLKLTTVITDKMWQGDGKDGDIQIYIDPEVTGTFNIGTIKLKSTDSDNNILIDSIIFYDEDVKAHQIKSVSANIKIDKNAESKK